MRWKIDVSRNADKFFTKNNLTVDEVKDLISRAIRYFQGEDINIDIKKLKGEWKGFYRIRSGDIRVIAEFNFESSVVFIEEIDRRGRVYK